MAHDDAVVLTEQDHFDLWRGLTAAQRAALCVLADGREHYCWKWATDPQAQLGKGCVNAKAVATLTKLKLARTTNWGGPFSGGSVEITTVGQAVWDASVFDA